jgi:hypothetical protein
MAADRQSKGYDFLDRPLFDRFAIVHERPADLLGAI